MTKPTIHTDIQLFTLHLIGIYFHLNISLLNIGNIGLDNRIIYKGNINQINNLLEKEINWNCIDIKISKMVDLTTNII